MSYKCTNSPMNGWYGTITHMTENTKTTNTFSPGNDNYSTVSNKIIVVD